MAMLRTPDCELGHCNRARCFKEASPRWPPTPDEYERHGSVHVCLMGARFRYRATSSAGRKGRAATHAVDRLDPVVVLLGSCFDLNFTGHRGFVGFAYIRRHVRSYH